jgi:tight adherence protein B
MDLLFPGIIAFSVGLLIWGLFRMMADPASREKRKLAERLSMEGRVSGTDPVARSIVRRMDVVGLPPRVAAHPAVQALNRRLIQAFPRFTLVKFLWIAVASGCVGWLVALAVSGSLLVSLGGFAFGTYIPFFVLNSKRNKRQRLIAEQLPEALDFLSRVLKAGHSFSTGLQMMADELPAPLSTEIRRCYDQHSLGQALDDSLKDTALRIESTDFAFFVTALLIQRQTGGDLSEVLKNISGMIRNRVRLAQQVKAKTAEGRFTGYILVAFPAVMFGLCYVQNPTYCGKLLHGTGLYFLGTAFGLQMLGLWSIKKITTVRV